MPGTVYYYTSLALFEQILKDGVLKPGLEIPPSRFILFSTNELWEATALPAARLTMHELIASGVRLARITFPREVAPHGWPIFSEAAQIGAKTAEAFERGARQLGANPAEWLFSFYEVPINKRIGVEQWDRGRWVSQDAAVDTITPIGV